MLAVENLTKKYGKFLAVNQLSLQIPKGHIFGFVGPNGAGKTTTMKIVAGLMRPTSGRVLIDGIDVTKNVNKVREKIGYMPDFFGVYDDLKVDEYLDFYCAAYQIPVGQRKKIIDQLLELVDLAHKRQSYVDSLSRGMKQRLCLARSLVHNPSLLILDEPASGLDPRARIEMKEILKELKNMGKTILISSHILPELAELCTSIGIVENGKIIAAGNVDEIMLQSSNSKMLKIKVLSGADTAVKIIKEQPAVENIIRNTDSIEFGFNGSEEETAKILYHLVNHGVEVTFFGEVQKNLEDVFMKITKGVATDAHQN
ncbi:ABC transporter ATP-binding protein [Petroclostridium sp. X23]|uniref:ABC transporter ATP-binding protein n=1 Tax=Petroclostridium sp. X23 TaxID=3045146 RepID=UPI0024ADDA06|nr:ABC transporter ATP-binding protein [Petroclostridium sp. X23]WHH59931.1 ABC transporter ATP-binding protein [Petroclostridium sp. X23]